MARESSGERAMSGSVTRPIMPSRSSDNAAPLSPGVGRAPVRPTPGNTSAGLTQGEGVGSAECTAERHGTFDTRHYGCTCPEHVAAFQRHRKRYRADYDRGARRFVPADTTRQQLRTLMAGGWPGTYLASRLGWRGKFGHLLYSSEKVTTATAEAVAKLYGELCDWPGPSTATRNRALRAGWRASWEVGAQVEDASVDIDPIAVERAMAGDRVTLTRTERDHVIRVLAERGCSDGDIATRLHMDRAAVCKHRSRHAIPSSLGRHSVRSDRDSASNTEGVA